MDLDGNSAPIVVNTDLSLHSINNNLNAIHILVTLLIVGGVDKNFIKDLVKTGNKANISHLHRIGFGIIYPHLLFAAFYRSNIGIRTLNNVFKLGKLCNRLICAVAYPEITDILTFWYWSVDLEVFFDFASAPPSRLEASFSFSCRGFAPAFLAVGALFCFFALGGVIERTEPSLCNIFSGVNCSSSESGLGRFETVGFAFGFKVVCAIFFGGALAAAAFLGAVFTVALGLALDF